MSTETNISEDTDSIDSVLRQIDPQCPEYAVEFADALLKVAVRRGASDIHLNPQADGLAVELRLNGVLESAGVFPRGSDSDPVVRLKVLADLLTYKTSSPQEGRLKEKIDGVEMRLSTFPTIHGERAVIRLFAAADGLSSLDSLGLPDSVSETLGDLCDFRDGAILVTGPAGSGKTTALYACLRRIASSAARRSVLTIEDPVESAIDGISQSQLEPALGMSLDAALRSMLRQDPEVVMVGEIRDPATAEAALQASLTGHLVFSSLHAGNVSSALRRLVEMKIAPYLIRSGLRAIISQRLLRRLCQCRQKADPAQFGLAADVAFVAGGCHRCHETGYVGRVPIAELLRLDVDHQGDVSDAIDRNLSAAKIQQAAIQSGMTCLKSAAIQRIEAGETSPVEAHRVLGPSFLA